MSLDTSILFLLATFIILLAVLKKLLFKPLMEQIEKRESLTSGYLKKAEELGEITENKIEEYKRTMHLTRKEIAEDLAGVQKAATERQKEIVDAAAVQSREIVEKAKAEIKEAEEEAEKELKEKTREISIETAEKILGRKI